MPKPSAKRAFLMTGPGSRHRFSAHLWLLLAFNLYPEHRHTLIYCLTSNKKIFSHFIKEESTFNAIRQHYPECFHELVSSMVAQPNTYATLLLNWLEPEVLIKLNTQLFIQLTTFILISPTIFKVAIPNCSVLLSTLNTLKTTFTTLYKKLAHQILQNPAEFKRLIKTKPQLEKLAKQLPEHATLLNQPSIQSVINKIISDNEKAIKENTETLCELLQSGHTLLSQLPNELLEYTSTLAANPHTHTHEEAKHLVRRYFT